jgi:lipopolysaccharide transport system ATP-binding protein
MSTAVEVSGLSKRYTLGRSREHGYSTLRDALAAALRPSAWRREPAPELWALRDVSFSVDEGEALGIIGGNGAGKSTLLKVLSRVTEPSAGRARLRGRVASLLEVGTGFHPELTGRENVYLNGSILGLTRAEIRRAFDAIVAFAEVERFLDTPVKRYSSGMYVRLAFAVAAHLTPEILIVDEVLAVGDHAFQQRCLGRMGDVARSGRTVLFVSHGLHAVEQLCPRALLLAAGRIERLGPSRDVVAHYLARRADEGRADEHGAADLAGVSQREGTGRARLTRLELLEAEADRPAASVEMGCPFRVRLHYDASVPLSGAAAGLAIVSPAGERVTWLSSEDTGDLLPTLHGRGTLDCAVPAPNLLPGSYRFDAWLIDPLAADYGDYVRGVGRLEVVVGNWDGPGRVALLTRPDRGHVHWACRWSAPS